jgi:5-(aminomethyl)-3-furanmethanol phosphate kinase
LNLIIIKLGGSLMRSSELSAWLRIIESLSSNSNVVIVPGGGEFADSVRSLQKAHEFDDTTAHRMALLAMCQYGYLLSGMSPKLKIVEDVDVLLSSLEKNNPLLWLPTLLFEDDSEIYASWDFTSDSIALWLATKLLATKLVLVKSRGINNDANTSIRKHIKSNYLDKGFQELSEIYSGEILFMEKSQYRQLIDLS